MADRRPDSAWLTERVFGADEARAYLDAPMSDDEREHTLSLVSWFRRRYPTPADRLAYVRRAYKRWNGMRGIGAEQMK